jgi:hypothetical protein
VRSLSFFNPARASSGKREAARYGIRKAKGKSKKVKARPPTAFKLKAVCAALPLPFAFLLLPSSVCFPQVDLRRAVERCYRVNPNRKIQVNTDRK